MLDWRLKAFRHWLTMREPHWARVHYAPIDYQAISYYSAPRSKTDGPKSLEEVDPKLLETYEKLGIPLHERARLAGVAVDAVFDSVSVATTFKERLRRGGRHLLPVLRGCAESSRPRRAVPGLGGALHGQLLRDAELRGLHRWLLRVCAERRALPDGAFHLLPHQRRQDRPVRAHADHRGRGQLRELPRGLHGADARREPAARRGGGADRARRCADQVLHGAELVPGRRAGPRRHLQLRHQARRVPRPQLAHLLDAGRDRFRDHLEIPELHPHAARTPSASSIRLRSPTTTSRPIPARR